MKIKLNSKDLINVGIFTLLYYIVAMIVIHIAFVPVIQLASMPLMALLCAPIYLVFVAKVGKFGGILLMGLICTALPGLVVFGSVTCFLVGFLFFVIAEFIAKIGKYKSQKFNNLSYVVVSFWSFGFLGMPWTAGEYFHKVCIDGGYSVEWADGVIAAATPLNLVIMLAATVVMAYVSIFFAKRLFRKHFNKAGILA